MQPKAEGSRAGGSYTKSLRAVFTLVLLGGLPLGCLGVGVGGGGNAGFRGESGDLPVLALEMQYDFFAAGQRRRGKTRSPEFGYGRTILHASVVAYWGDARDPEGVAGDVSGQLLRICLQNRYVADPMLELGAMAGVGFDRMEFSFAKGASVPRSSNLGGTFLLGGMVRVNLPREIAVEGRIQGGILGDMGFSEVLLFVDYKVSRRALVSVGWRRLQVMERGVGLTTHRADVFGPTMGLTWTF